MTSFESISVVADLIFGLVMLVYGFAGGLFVAGWVLRKCVPHGPSEKMNHNGPSRTGHQGRKA